MTKTLPKILPIFPLENILFLPSTNLPLYVFEQRYLNMVNDALLNDKIIGMIQLTNTKSNTFREVFKIGCAGKIIFYEKTNDNKILLVINGFSRFKIKKELSLKDGYRRVVPIWDIFKNDGIEKKTDNKSKEQLLQNVKSNIQTLNHKFFKKQLDEISTNEIVQIIARELSLSNIENQSIIESKDNATRVSLLIKLLQNSIFSDNKSIH